MGKHYVPQKYLSGFESPKKANWVWMFDKQSKLSKLLPIKHVAQEADFYDEDVEKMMTDVEITGFKVFDKVCQDVPISKEERDDFAYFIATMISRVPHARNIGIGLLPELLSSTIAKIRKEVDEAFAAKIITEERRAAFLVDVEATEKKFSTAPPEEVVKQLTEPWPFESMLSAVTNMQWRIVRSKGPTFFLSSDNPASFFECFGLGTALSELIFPLKHDLLLHGCYQPERGVGIMDIPQQMVKSFNRKIAFYATRFIFFHEEAKWLSEVIRNNVEQLDRTQWL